MIDERLDVKKWRKHFIYNYLHIFLFISLCIMMIMIVWSSLGFSRETLLPICIIHITLFIPIIALKINFRIRVGNYLKVIKKGYRVTAKLELIEDANIYRGRWLGFTHRFIFHIKVFSEGVCSRTRFVVVCTKIDPEMLHIKEYNNQYILPEETEIPVVKYKNKAIVLQNECGFYDLAHDSSKVKTIAQYW
ncbi:MAG: hypothetical protein K6G76_06180 [Lachnospiraceae bacterium]|nr:hypothetical protein [Lachnospiraceae bacterium]